MLRMFLEVVTVLIVIFLVSEPRIRMA